MDNGRGARGSILDKSHNIYSLSDLMNTPQQGHNAKVKWYGDTAKVTCFDKPVFGKERTRAALRSPDRSGDLNADRERDDSRKRAIDKVYDLVYANRWEWWLTLTLDPKLIDRCDPEIVTKAATKWFSNLVQRNGVAYVAVLEFHADHEGLHVHALMTGDIADRMIDSGHKDSSGHKVYNFTRWKYGYSTAIRTYKQGERLARYMTKYMTKQTDKIGGRWYWSGGKLNRTVPTDFVNMDYDRVSGKEYTIAGANLRVKYFTERVDGNGQADT